MEPVQDVAAVLARLFERIDATGDLSIYADDIAEWPPEALSALLSARLLVRAADAELVTCPGCEDACRVRPQTRARPSGGPVLVHPCQVYAGMGLITIPVEARHRWQLSLPGLRDALRRALGLSGREREIEAERAWSLGAVTIRQRQVEVLFAVRVGGAFSSLPVAVQRALEEEPIVVLVLHQAPEDAPCTAVRLSQYVGFGRDLILDRKHFEGRASRTPSLRPFQVPPGTRWEQLTLRVGDEGIEAVIPGRGAERRTIEELGMIDLRSGRPDQSWVLLRAFAQLGGSINWEDRGAADAGIRVRIKRLRDRLEDAFEIRENPFKPYHRRRGWEARSCILWVALDEEE